MNHKLMTTVSIPRFRSEHFFIGLILLIWGKDILFRYARAIVLRIPYVSYIADYFFPTMVAICLILALPYFFKRLSWKDIMFMLSIAVVYLFQMLFYEKTSETLLSLLIPFCSALALYFIGAVINSEKHMKYIYYMSIINIWTFAVYTIFFGGDMLASQAEHSGSMFRAYALLPQVLVTLAFSLEKTNRLNVVSSITGFAFLLMCGNRGSIVLCFLFAAFYTGFMLKKENRWKICMALGIVGTVFTLYFEDIMRSLAVLFTELGMSSRIIMSFFSGSFFESRGRSEIAQTLWSAIWEKPILGHGIAADRIIAGAYAHNLAIELWVSFGIFVGSSIIIFIFTLVVRGWKSMKSLECKAFFLTLLCTGLLKLFISSSYLLEGMFFMFLGFCINQIRQKEAF